MEFGQMVLVAYAVLMLIGGFMGYRAAGSAKSMIAGAASAFVLAVAWFVSRSFPATGYAIGAVASLGLCVVFGVRLAKTRKAMPSGVLLAVSGIALMLLVFAATSWLQ